MKPIFNKCQKIAKGLEILGSFADNIRIEDITTQSYILAGPTIHNDCKDPNAEGYFFPVVPTGSNKQPIPADQQAILRMLDWTFHNTEKCWCFYL